MLDEATAKERARLKGPLDTLSAIADGLIVSLDHKREVSYVEEWGGREIRDPEFPDRKMLVAGGMTLYWAGYLDQFGALTDAGRKALAESQ